MGDRDKAAPAMGVHVETACRREAAQEGPLLLCRGGLPLRDGPVFLTGRTWGVEPALPRGPHHFTPRSHRASLLPSPCSSALSLLPAPLSLLFCQVETLADEVFACPEAGLGRAALLALEATVVKKRELAAFEVEEQKAVVAAL